MATSGAARISGLLQRFAVTLLFACAILFGGVVGILLAYETDLPQISSLEDFEPNIITQVYNVDGSLLGSFSIELPKNSVSAPRSRFRSAPQPRITSITVGSSSRPSSTCYSVTNSCRC